MTTLEKYVSDDRVYQFDFSAFDEVSGGASIASVTGVTADLSGLTIGTPGVSDDGESVLVRISGGTTQQTYTVTAVVVTNTGSTLTGSGYLVVCSRSRRRGRVTVRWAVLRSGRTT
jgi:hypothetical protein